MNNNTLGARFMLLVFVLIVSVSAAVSAQVHNKDYYYERARWRLSSGNNTGALEDLNLIISLTPNDPGAYNTRGIIYEKSGNYTAARADYEYALRLNPDSAEARHNINNLNEKLNHLNLANTGTMPPVFGTTPPVSGTAPPVYTQYSPNQQVIYTQVRPVQQQSAVPVQPIQQTSYTQVRPVQQRSAAPVQTVQQTSYTQVRPLQQATYGSVQSAAQTENKNFVNTSAVNYNRSSVNIGLFRQTGALLVSGGYGQVLQPAAFRTGEDAYQQPGYNAPTRRPFIDAAAENCNNYGVALNSYGRFEEAVLKFTEAVEIYPEYAIAYNNRGVAYAAIGDSVRATEDFINALRINPYYYDAQVNYQRINGNMSVAALTQ
jgi:Flp pilus assembly protein TadD